MPHTPPVPYDRHAAAAGDAWALEAAVDALSELGARALAEDATNGSAWGLFADWAYQHGYQARPASAATVQAWLSDHGSRLPVRDQVDVLDAISAVHCKAGVPDPTRNRP